MDTQARFLPVVRGKKKFNKILLERECSENIQCSEQIGGLLEKTNDIISKI